jgi:hypothetical protein
MRNEQPLPIYLANVRISNSGAKQRLGHVCQDVFPLSPCVKSQHDLFLLTHLD